MPAYINFVTCAVPPFERQQDFIESLPAWTGTPEVTEKLRQITKGAQIETRYTVLDQPFSEPGGNGFYRPGEFPATGRRMEVYKQQAPLLALGALRELEQVSDGLSDVTHLIVTSCTGFYAPGLDIDIVRALGLSPSVERTIVGFMGCQAALVGLRNARQIVDGNPDARVLMVNLELCSLHLQQTEKMDRLVSFLLFADGCAASLITSDPQGLRIEGNGTYLSLEDSERMAWHIEDSGFAMTLDSRLPARIRQFLRDHEAFATTAATASEMLWAIHPGGRLILDSVQSACGIPDEQMAGSREVLRRYGNMSSASIMFVLRGILESQADATEDRPGRAIAFGPGLTVEVMDFTLLAESRDATFCEVEPVVQSVGSAG